MKSYTGSLPYPATQPALREAVSGFSPIVDFHLPVDRESGQSRAFAFATLSSRDIGEEAIRHLDGADFGGRKLRVSEAEDRPRDGNRRRN